MEFKIYSWVLFVLNSLKWVRRWQKLRKWKLWVVLCQNKHVKIQKSHFVKRVRESRDRSLEQKLASVHDQRSPMLCSNSAWALLAIAVQHQCMSPVRQCRPVPVPVLMGESLFFTANVISRCGSAKPRMEVVFAVISPPATILWRYYCCCCANVWMPKNAMLWGTWLQHVLLLEPGRRHNMCGVWSSSQEVRRIIPLRSRDAVTRCAAYGRRCRKRGASFCFQ